MAQSWRWAHAVLPDSDGENSVIEILSARMMFGPGRTPEFTTANLWHEGRHYTSVGLLSSLRNSSQRRGDRCAFRLHFDGGLVAEGEYGADPSLSVELSYRSPDGRRLRCRNCKTGFLRLNLSRRGRPLASLRTDDQAAVEFASPEGAA